MGFLDWDKPLPQPWYGEDWPQERRRRQRAERIARWLARAWRAIIVGVAVLGWVLAIASLRFA
jgi:hypothetical protein